MTILDNEDLDSNQQKYLPMVFLSNKTTQLEFDNTKQEDFFAENDFDIEFGVRFLNDIYLDISSKLSSFTISRDIEFYNENQLSPYIKLNFQDIQLVKTESIFFKNSLELNYMTHTQQVPFYPNNGKFPYNNSYDIDSTIKEFQLFWKGSICYKASFFSIGGYIGAGINMMSGNSYYFRYAPTDINSTSPSNLIYFDNRVFELGEEIKVDTTSSILTKYGLDIGFNFLPFHIGFGIDFSITNESNLYWFERSYFMEISYISSIF